MVRERNTAELACDVPMAFEDMVLAAVPDISWSDEVLDLVETDVLAALDGVTPVALLETTLEIPADELRSVLAMLLARRLVVACGPSPFADEEPASGTYDKLQPTTHAKGAARRRR